MRRSWFSLPVHRTCPKSDQNKLELCLQLINPRRACAARVTVVVLCVCLSCLSTAILGLQIPTSSVPQGHENETGDFAETTAFERYGVKTS